MVGLFKKKNMIKVRFWKKFLYKFDGGGGVGGGFFGGCGCSGGGVCVWMYWMNIFNFMVSVNRIFKKMEICKIFL